MTEFREWLGQHRWLLDRNRPFLFSADGDGLACGLLLSHVLGWRCVGIVESEAGHFHVYEDPTRIPWEEVAFLDVEVFRPEIRSIGNHLVTLDAADAEVVSRACPLLASPGIARGIHFEGGFSRKYPFGTLPLVACALADAGLAAFDIRHLPVLYFTDSSLENAVAYKANALDWLRWMGAEDRTSPLAPLCRLATRQTIFEALGVLDAFQQDAHAAGFGRKEKALRFTPDEEGDRAKATRLRDVLIERTGWTGSVPTDRAPVATLRCKTARLTLDGKRRSRASFARARTLRALTLAATARNETGLSFTKPPNDGTRFRDLWS